MAAALKGVAGTVEEGVEEAVVEVVEKVAVVPDM
jgi:hypothetical protein